MSTKKKYGKEKITSANEDIALHFPNLTTFDTAQNCPAYMKILQRTKGGSVYIKELDSLQREIETIVLSIKKRKATIIEESKILATYQEKDTKKNICNQLKSTANGKRANSTESKPLKKHKSGNSQSYATRPKAKNSQVVKTEAWSTDSAVEVIHKPAKGDASGRFWAALEPYFSEITQDHLKFIEEWMQSNDDNEEYFEIPSLGKHFAYEWSQKEIEEEKREGAKASENDKKDNSDTTSSTPSEDINVEDLEEKDNCENTMNPLSQQLLNALIEEKVIAGLEDTIDASKELPECEEVACIQSNSVEPPTVKKSKCLEDRIKEELIALGVLEESGEQETNETDFSDGNLVEELKEAQASLRMMMEHNFNKKLQLMKLAREEINKQEIRKKLNIIDTEIMDLLRKNPKKKILSKKERDNAMRLLSDRKVYMNQLKTSKL